MIHYTAEEGKVYDKLVFPNGDKYAQYFPLEGNVGTSYYYQAKRVDFSENEDEPDKISLSYIKFLLDGGKIKTSSVDADLPKYEAFEGVQTKANNSLQKPEIAPTKTKLVGVGANGQENIEIGDNLTLANGKLSATGGGSGGEKICIVKINVNDFTYTSNIPLPTDGTTPVFGDVPGFYDCIYPIGYGYNTDDQGSHYVSFMSIDEGAFYYGTLKNDGKFALDNIIYINKYYYHFITMTDSASNVALYLTIQNTSETKFDAFSLHSYLAGIKVLANGNLHGSVPTYIEGGVVSGTIKVYYMNPGDNNINPDPDVFTNLSSFTITDDVSPVE